MRFALHSSVHNGFNDVTSLAMLVDDAGFSDFLLCESQLRRVDPYIGLAIAASSTKNVKLGIGVTNPVLRDPSVIACGMNSVDQLSGGRAIICIGTGDGAVYSVGKKGAKLAVLEQAVNEIRSLTSGETIVLNAVKARMTTSTHALPIYVAADGPKTLRLAGRIADGIIVSSGLDEDVIAWAKTRIAEGCRDSGRNIDEIDIMFCGIMNMDKDREKAIEDVRGRVANRAHHNFSYTTETVPSQYLDDVKKFMGAFDVTKSVEEKVPRELVIDYLVNRFSIAGDSESVVSKIRRIEKEGVKHLMITPIGMNYKTTLRMFTEEVMPNFR